MGSKSSKVERDKEKMKKPKKSPSSDKKAKQKAKKAKIPKDSQNLKDKKTKERVKKHKTKSDNKGKVAEDIGDSKTKNRTDSGGVCQGKEDFVDFVHDTLKANFDLITIGDIETYISTRYRTTVDAFNRRKIIQKVVADEFLKGCIAVRTTKGNCP